MSAPSTISKRSFRLHTYVVRDGPELHRAVANALVEVTAKEQKQTNSVNVLRDHRAVGATGAG
jgi:hypothetical protein